MANKDLYIYIYKFWRRVAVKPVNHLQRVVSSLGKPFIGRSELLRPRARGEGGKYTRRITKSVVIRRVFRRQNGFKTRWPPGFIPDTVGRLQHFSTL